MGVVAYRGFWIRVLAVAVDSAILAAVSWLPYRALVFTDIPYLALLAASFGIVFLVSAAYEILFTSFFGGTIGKLLLGIQVCDADGHRIGIPRSIGRYFAKFLSGLLLGIGYLMVTWDEKKQGLHDKLAKTYVTDDIKTRVAPALRTAVKIVAIAIIICYLVYNSWIAGSAMVDGFNVAFKPIVSGNAHQEIDARCDGRWYKARDMCYSTYIQADNESLLNLSERLLMCKDMSTAEYRAACINNIAVHERNESMCDTIDGWRSRECKKNYAFMEGLRSSLHPQVSYRGNLSVDQVIIEREVYDECLPSDNATFTTEEVMCVTIHNATGFVVGNGNLHWYRMDVFTWDAQDHLIDVARDLFKDDHRIYLYNDTVDEETFVLRLEKFAPGNYTTQIELFDRVSEKGWSKNITFTVTPPQPKMPELQLELQEFVFGRPGSLVCNPGGLLYTKGESICFMPVALTGFETDADGINSYDVDVKMWNGDGKLITYEKRILGEEGHILLRNNTINMENDPVAGKWWINFNTSLLSPGVYTYELTIYDYVSKRRVAENFTFEIEDATQEGGLEIQQVIVGKVSGDRCIDIGEGSISSYPITMACLQPTVTGFSVGADGYSSFDMQITVMDGNLSTLIFESPRLFQDRGRQLLENGTLKGQYGSVPFFNQPSGLYQLKLTVYDRVSGKNAFTWAALKVK